MSDDLDALLDAGKLLAATTWELSLEVSPSDTGDPNSQDAQRYHEMRHYLGEHLDTASSPQDAATIASWRATLHEVGDLRQVIASNVMAHQTDLVRGEQASLAAEAADLRKALDALQDVQQAIDDAATVTELTSTLFTLKSLVEIVESGDPWDLVDLLPGLPGTEDMIEQGIANLGQYGVMLTLVSHGYASIEELRRAIQSSLSTLEEIRNRIAWAKHRYETAQYFYATPPMGGD